MNFLPGDVLASIRERAFSYFARPFSTEKLAEMIRIAMAEPLWDDGIEISLCNSRLGPSFGSLRCSDRQSADSIFPRSLGFA